jgi:hypothetical protein
VSTGSATGVEDGEEGDDAEQDPCPDFQPVIPLPAEVEIITGEEAETVLFESWAKLFRYLDAHSHTHTHTLAHSDTDHTINISM